MTKSCGCRYCRQSCDFKELYQALPQELHSILCLIQSELVHTQEELNYMQAIFDGTWPNAEEHMKRLGWGRVD